MPLNVLCFIFLISIERKSRIDDKRNGSVFFLLLNNKSDYWKNKKSATSAYCQYEQRVLVTHSRFQFIIRINLLWIELVVIEIINNNGNEPTHFGALTLHIRTRAQTKRIIFNVNRNWWMRTRIVRALLLVLLKL